MPSITDHPHMSYMYSITDEVKSHAKNTEENNTDNNNGYSLV